MNIQRKSITWFLVLAFGLGWILFLLPLAFGSPAPQAAALVCWSAAMWAPGLAAILATRFVDRDSLGRLNFTHLGEKRAYLWAWLLPPVLAVLAGVVTWALGMGTLDLTFAAMRAQITQASGSSSLPFPVQVLVAINLSAAITIAPLINTLFAFGEELGWRGYLLPRLLPLGQGRALLLSGIIWGLWHAPVILQGHNYPGHPYLGVLLMVGFCILLGTILGWLYLRTGSPWAPALGHGAVNAVAGLPLLFISGVDITFGGTLASLAGWLPLGLFVGWLVWSRRLPVGTAGLQPSEAQIPAA